MRAAAGLAVPKNRADPPAARSGRCSHFAQSAQRGVGHREGEVAAAHGAIPVPDQIEYVAVVLAFVPVEYAAEQPVVGVEDVLPKDQQLVD